METCIFKSMFYMIYEVKRCKVIKSCICTCIMLLITKNRKDDETKKRALVE